MFSQALPSAKPEEIGVSTARLEELNKMIQDHINRGELAGVVTLIEPTTYRQIVMSVRGRKPSNHKG